MSVGRDGASDAVSFLASGVPAVEFGPIGDGPPRARGVGLDHLAAQLPPGARGLREALPRDGRGMSPERRAAERTERREPRADETQEHELGDDFARTTGDGRTTRTRSTSGSAADDDLERTRTSTTRTSTRTRTRSSTSTRTSSTRSISAETQEWDGAEAAEAHGEAEQTLVASAAERGQAGRFRDHLGLREGRPRPDRHLGLQGRSPARRASRSGCAS